MLHSKLVQQNYRHFSKVFKPNYALKGLETNELSQYFCSFSKMCKSSIIKIFAQDMLKLQNMCDALWDLVLFVKFKKRENVHEECYFNMEFLKLYII